MEGTRAEFTLPIVAPSDRHMLTDVSQWRAWAEDTGGFVLRGFPGDPTQQRAMDIANAIGMTGDSAVGIRGELASGVYAVTPANGEIKDARGVTLLSSTFHEIPLHTDGYNAGHPPLFVVLQVARTGVTGFSTVAVLDDVIHRLTAESADLLSDDVYPTTAGTTRILHVDGNRTVVRFNGYEIAEHIRCGHNVSRLQHAHLVAVSELGSVLWDLAVKEPRNRTMLLRGDVLVVSNRRVLHGRSSLDHADRDRMLHRVWCH